MSDIKDIAKKIYESMGLLDVDLSDDSTISKLFLNVIEEIYNEYLDSNGIPKGISSIPKRISDENDIDKLISLCEYNGISLFSSTAESIGEVNIIFSKKNTFIIPAGSVFYSGDAEFNTTEELNISELSYSLYAPGLYSLNNVRVINKSGSIAERNTLYSKTAYEGLYKINHERISPSSRKNTVGDLRSLIKSKINNGIKHVIMSKFPSVNVDIISSGDELMTRDIMYIAYPYTVNYVKSSSFVGKVRGNTEINKNIAYKLIMEEDGLTDPIDIIDPYDEFTQDQYLCINSKVGGVVSVSTEDIVNANFSGDSNRIGISSTLVSKVSSGDKELLLKEPSKFSEGDQLYIREISTKKIVFYDVIKEIYHKEVAVTYGEGESNSIFVSCDITKMLFPRNIIIGKTPGGSFEQVNVARMSFLAGVTTVETYNAFSVRIDKILIPCIKTYRSINIDINTIANYIVEIPDTSGISIGGSWIKSESGMDIGCYKDETMAVVANGELVIGNVIGNNVENPMISLILKYGKNKFASDIRQCINVSGNTVADTDDLIYEDNEI